MQIQTFQTSLNSLDVFIQPNEILLDIETTGLSPDISTVFMIGCGYFHNQQLHMIHWMADDLTLESEQDVLHSFSDWIHSKFEKHTSLSIITFNGKQFDLPFLQSRFNQCNILWPSILNSETAHADYFRITSRIKHVLPISNLKLHTLASFLGYKQTKTPSGRLLIKTYHKYIKEKDPATLNLLFQHNKEDIEALAYVTSIQSYLHLFEGAYHIQSIEYSIDMSHILICLKTGFHFPCQLSANKNGFKIDLNGTNVQISVPVYNQGLRFYYSDYKNYIYLIEEDYALHRSMATYIDKSHWTRANADNCYTWFAPDNAFFNDKDQSKSYIQMIFSLFGFL